MLKIKQYPETDLEDESLYNIYSISFNNIKAPESSSVLIRYFNRIFLLEQRAFGLIKQFHDYVDVSESELTLVRRSLSSHSELKWKLKVKGKWNMVSSSDPRLSDYLLTLEKFTAKTIRSYFLEVKMLTNNLKIEWTRYFSFCDTAEISNDEILVPKDIPKAIEIHQGE